MIAEAALLAGGAGLAVGGLGLLAVHATAKRSLAAAAVLAPVVVVVSVVAGVLVTSRAMFISEHDRGVVLVVIGISLPIALLFGLLIASRVQRLSRRATEEAAARRRDQEVEASRRELVAWVSHDLRTPLAGIHALAEAIEDGMAPADGSYAARIRAEADRMAGMISGLLALSRLQSGTLRLERTTVDLGDLVSDTVASARVLAAPAGVAVTGSAPAGVTAEVDASELSRALTNLLTNAVRHTPAGEEVVVTLRTGDGEATFAVADACGGIPEEHLPRLFEPGWRGTTARTPGAGEGAGLGLAVARGIAEAHGGSVSARNEGRGCRFELTVPVSHVSSPSPAPLAAAGTAAAEHERQAVGTDASLPDDARRG